MENEALNQHVKVLRIRKGVPGIGRKLARHFSAYEITALKNPAHKIRPRSVVINYGNSNHPVWFQQAMNDNVLVLNHPANIRHAADKLQTMDILSKTGVPTVRWTNSQYEALQWLQKGKTVYARTITAGKQGKGIMVMTCPEEFVEAPLYTLWYNQTHEFRVHVVAGEVVDFVQKKMMGKKKLAERGLEQADAYSRNHKKGWVFAHNDLVCNNKARDTIGAIGVRAVLACGLDYGAPDILARIDENGALVPGNANDPGAVICEVNSAPGMSAPTTFKRYVKAFEEIIENHIAGE